MSSDLNTPNDLQLDELEAFFKKRKLPDNFKLNAAITIYTFPLFIQKTIILLKSSDITDLIKKVRWDDLCQIKAKIELQEANEQPGN